ncbi:MAG: tRNA 2-thiocytidine biosynthesis TtcA family protein, partial [archaeon]
MNIEKKVAETIKKYRLIKKSDKVIVALSGGKDSTSVLYILKKMGYSVEGLMIDLYLGRWSELHKENMIRFCKEINVPLTIVDLKKELGQGICFIKAVLKKQKNLTGCTVCGIIKRWILNKWAKKMGADKLVTGHNLDDEAQNVLMNFLKGNILLGVNSSPATGGACPRSSDTSLVEGSEFGKRGTEKREPPTTDHRPPTTDHQLGNGFVQRVKPLFF